MLKKYFDNYDSQEDEDYNPTKLQQALYNQQHQKKKKIGTRTTAVNDLWQQLQQQHKNSLKKVKPNEIQQPVSGQVQQQKNQQEQQIKPPTALQLAQRILNNDNIKPDKRIIFAGKQFIMNQQTGQLQIAQKIKSQVIQPIQMQNKQDQQHYQLRKTRIAYHYLNHVMRAIYNRSRKINSVGKSKLDWKGFVKQEGIQHKLNYHRKGGVIKDMQFLKNAT